MVTGMFTPPKRKTFDSPIETLTWMGTATKTKAREKLAAMGEKIAYPDRWIDYSGLELSDSYTGNVRSTSAYTFIHEPQGLDKIGGPVNPDNWFIAPQVVNAFSIPQKRGGISHSDPQAPVLRSEFRSLAEIRNYPLGYRPRDDARLR